MNNVHMCPNLLQRYGRCRLRLSSMGNLVTAAYVIGLVVFTRSEHVHDVLISYVHREM